jgi:hypothetical protein
MAKTITAMAMYGLLYAFLLYTLIQASPTLRSATSICKSVPGDASWPSADTWAALNTTLSGRLLAPLGPGAVCHKEQPSYSTAQCAAVQASWSNEFFHVEDPVSVEWNNWTNDTCLPDASVPCSNAGYPLYVINATTAEHVKAGIDFGMLTK